MTKNNNYKLLLAIGLLMLSAGTCIGLFLKGLDFINGFLKGMGIVFVLFSFLKMKKESRQSAN